jgi:glycosyl transferase family 2
VDIAVIICAYTVDRWDLLTQGIDAVRHQTLLAAEVILVVDDNEELLQRARRELSDVTVVPNRHSQGLSGARQTGADIARSPILAFLDDDAIPSPQWLAEMAAAYDHPEVLGAGGPVEPLWLAPPPAWLPPEYFWVIGCTYAGIPIENGRIRNPIGANMSMRAKILRRAGSFEPTLARTNRGKKLSGTAEETEFCIRATRMHPGGYWAYRAGARVLHAVPPERTTWRYFVRRCRLEAAAKAVLTGLTGTSAGLQSEKAYARSVLPRAVARELKRVSRGEVIGLARAGAIVAGLLITAASYVGQTMLLRARSLTRSKSPAVARQTPSDSTFAAKRRDRSH